MDLQQLEQSIDIEKAKIMRLKEELSRVIIGQQSMIEGLLIGLLTGGHVLLEGLPGLAKSLTVSTLAKALSLDFQRIQFTPDLLPSDLIGTMIFNPQTAEFSPKKGPIFSNLVLADEINRAPAKVQSALLECMAEKQVTIGQITYKLESPFLVLATQNPIEQEGTFPLPEAQMDRFLFKITVPYPSFDDELEILSRMSKSSIPQVQSVLTKEELLTLKKTVESIYIDDKMSQYIVQIVQASRKPSEYGASHLEHLIAVGASPRATLGLAAASRAQAFIKGRSFVSPEDIKRVAYPILRHRLILSYEAQAEEMTADNVIKELLDSIEVA